MPTRVLRCNGDAYVAADTPDANHGAETTLKVESRDFVGPANKRLLCAFDLAGLPATAVRVTEARLRLVPTRQAADRTLRCHEVTGAWTEDGVTWDDQPAVGRDHGTKSSNASPQEWDVTPSAQAPFPGGRAAFRVRDDAEGSLVSQLQEYASLESTGTPPELVVTYEDQGRVSLASRVAVAERRGTTSLGASLQVRRGSGRFQQFRRVGLRGADGGATAPAGIAYDAGRDAFWVADQASRKVRRYARASLALEREYDLPPGFQPLGCAFDGEFVWLSDDLGAPMTIRRFRVGATALTEEASYRHDLRAVLAWDGAALWSGDPATGLITKHRADATLSVAEAYEGLLEVWGLAFPTDGDGDAYTLENLGSQGFRIGRRRADGFGLVETFAYRGRGGDTPMGLAFAPGPASRHLYNAEEGAGDLLVRPGLDLASTVRPANIARSTDLGSSVRPRNIPRSAALASRLRANVPGQAALGSQLRPRLDGGVGLASAVRPRETVVVAHCLLRGILATRVVVDEQDFLDISAEVGSSITHTSRGVGRPLRRVVQLVETRESVAFPREVTSERGRGSTQDALRRGDALLFAHGRDVFRPGDTVGWRGLTWVVVGVLGAEMVGDVTLYQEVGLRRLPVMVMAGARGTVAAAPE